MSQTEVTNRLAVEHLTCTYCGAVPGKACVVVSKLGNFFRNEFGIKVPRAVPHQVRRDPFIEAWVDGYQFAESESISAHG